jgi:hypothetical protein
MATRIYSINPGDNEFQVTEAVGAANVTKNIELTVNTSATLITDSNSPTGFRAITREDVLEAIDKLENYILNKNWPPS